MKATLKLALVAAVIAATLAPGRARSQITIVSDNCTAANVNSGFALGEGVNSAIYPPYSNRITGTVGSNLRYLKTGGNRADSNYTINGNRLRVGTQTEVGRFSISGNGVNPYNFAAALGTAGASPADPAIYDVRISMRNDATSTARLSFGIATAEGDVTTWDFGVQIYRAATGNDYYTVQKRIDGASSGAGGGDVNAVMTTTAAGTAATLVNFLIRITDAGAETSAYSSRVQVSMDNGTTWIYDTSTDGALSNGFRFDGAARVIVWDQASNGSGQVFYDNFSIVSQYAPPPPPERVWTGGGSDDNWSTAANWGGTAPNSGEPLLFGLSARQVNLNDLTLDAPSLTFTNGGFVLTGNSLALDNALNNLAGSNTLGMALDWPLTGGKNWQLAAGTELHLTGYSTWSTLGDHVIYGGGTLRLSGAVDVNQAPAFIMSEGKFILDGGTYNSMGGFRIGSSAGAVAPVEVQVSNNASLTLELTTANLRVGDGATAVPSRLIINNGTVSFYNNSPSAGRMAIPYAAGCTGEVWQTGGLVRDAYVVFSDSGAGMGMYGLTNGVLETLQIRKGNAGGTALMRFQNAMLRPALGAIAASFMSGLDLAEIQSGGLTIDATSGITIPQTLSGAGGLMKVNSEAVTLTGMNTYAGNTVLQEGTLVLPTVQTNAAAIQAAGGTELGVIRTVADSTLTAGSLSLGGGTLSFELGAFASPRAPLMKVNSLTASGGAGSVTINITGGLGLTAGQFALVDYSGSIGGSGFAAFNLVGLPPGISAELVNNTGDSSVDLKITVAPGLRWTGANGTSWDYGTVNWYDEGASANSTYTDGQPIRFLDGASTGVVDLTSTFAPLGLTVSNSSLAYVFRDGGLSLSRLIKLGDGTLTRADGTDMLPELELNGGRYVSSNTMNASLSPLLTDTSGGQGTFIKSGTATLTVSSNNATFNGAFLIHEGTLLAGNAGALGTTNGSTTITNGGTLDVNNLNLGREPIFVSGVGADGLGAIIDSTTNTGVQIALIDVTMMGNTTLGSPNGGRWDLRVRTSTGPGPGLRGNGFDLTKVGSGMVSIACQRQLGVDTPYWEMNLGDVKVQEGILAFAESLSLGNPSKTIAVSAGATLQLYDLNVTNPLPRNITLTNAQLVAGGSSEHTNVLTGSITLNGAIGFDLNQAAFILNGPLEGTGSLNISANDPGRVYFNGTNTHSGDTTVTNGTVGGLGVIGGNLLMLGGTNSPGSQDVSVGTLKVNGTATLAGTTRLELAPGENPNCDQLDVTGALTFGGTLQVALAAGAAAPQAGDVYQLFNKGGGGAFAVVTLPNLTGNLSWKTNELASLGRISVEGGMNPPTIVAPIITDGNLILAGTAGTANGSYVILTSTNVAAPLAEWITNSTGTFSDAGAFSNAIPVTPGEPQRYFRIKQP